MGCTCTGDPCANVCRILGFDSEVSKAFAEKRRREYMVCASLAGLYAVYICMNLSVRGN